MLVYPRVSRNRQDHKCSQELRLGSLPRWAQRELSCEPSWYDWRWSMTFSLYICIIYVSSIYCDHLWSRRMFFSASWQICSKAPARCRWCQWCQSACLRQQSPKWAASRCHDGKMVKIENLNSKMWEKKHEYMRIARKRQANLKCFTLRFPNSLEIVVSCRRFRK